MQSNSKCFQLSGIFLVFLITAYFPVKAVAKVTDSAGQIVSLYGDVWVSSGRDNPWRKITRSQNIYIGYTIKTGRLSGVSLRMEDESLIRLSQKSEFKVEGVRVSSFWRRATSLVSGLNRGIQSTYRLLTGKLWGRNNNRQLNSKVVTATATIGIRGTEYSIEANEKFSSVTIMEGVVVAENEFGETLISSGEQAITRAGQAPQKSTTVQTGSSVQWTVQVPELINLLSYLKRSVSNKTITAEIYQAYQLTQFAKAQNLIKEELSKKPSNTDLHIVNAWLNLKAGENQTAYQLLSALNSNDSALLEMKAFSAFLTGNIDQANKIVNQLKVNNKLSDMGWVVSGYLAQANYDLAEAEEAYVKALEINTDNQLARVQLATVYFGSEQEQRALNLINISLRTSPDFLPAMNLKGFILLARNETSNALKTWQQNESTGNANAETYFGLSLAYMRKGEVEDAMQSIATAVLLDPQRSLYLSYWGKMLNQIGRNDKALTVLNSAIRLDDKDPTPLLYKAIILRDLNRPGEAIQNIQAAVKLNDNKGVYRSRSLLDKDLAVQNVDLSRLFTQLGLADWAQKKAMDSIKSDFSNVSAHILNAGAYAEQGDRAYALANEALLARLLQPANINTFSSFNGYTSLYETPDTEFDLQLGLGNHGQQSLSLIAAGAAPEKQMAWALATVYDDSDGWRDTNDEKFDNFSTIVKWQPSSKNNFLFTLSATEIEQFDNFYNRYEVDSDVDPVAEINISSLQLEFGFHHKLSPDHDLLTYFSSNDTSVDQVDDYQEDLLVGPDILSREGVDNFHFERPQTIFQLQGLYKLKSHQLFYGLLVLNGENSSVLDDTFKLFDPSDNLLSESALSSSHDLDITFRSLYLQDSWQINSSLLLDLALYIEDMDNSNSITGGEWSVTENTTRFGLVWEMNNQHTFRLASFEYLLPFITSRIDPTDIAGIPIYKNTNEGSLVTEADIVWDYEWDKGLISTTLFKVEESYTSAVLNGSQQLETTVKSEKQGVSVNFNTLIGFRTGLNLGLAQFEVEDESFPENDRDESNAALSLTHMHRNGFIASLKQVMRNMSFDSAREEDTINVTNLLLSYEFSNKTQHVELEIINMFDEEFNWVTDKFTTTGIAPERMFTMKYTLSF